MSDRAVNVDLLLKTVETQATVIDLLSGACDELFAELMQHVTVEEADRSTGLAMMRQAALLKNRMEGGGPHEHY